jgi:dGTPase
MKFKKRERQDLERLEQETLAPYARCSAGAGETRLLPEPEHPYRTAFQRDRDRIIHSRAFRRLKHKRQVFLTHVGDHYRARLTHTMEVSQISRTLARALGVNEDLTEAIALGHDLGHTPFGHLGEQILDHIMSGKETLGDLLPGTDYGGFKHNYQSLRVVDLLERKYAFRGLNLTAPVREGILKHTRLRRGRYRYPDFYVEGLFFERDAPSTIEAQVVAVSDEVAQRTHDLEDGLRAHLVELSQVRELQVVKLLESRSELGRIAGDDPFLYQNLLIRALVDYLVTDIIGQTLRNLSAYAERVGRAADFDETLVWFSPELDPLQKELNQFIYKEIIYKADVRRTDLRVETLIKNLFRAYYMHPSLLPDYVQERLERGADGEILSGPELQRLDREAGYVRVVCDHIAGMTDNFAVEEMRRVATVLEDLPEVTVEGLALVKTE